MIDLDDLLKNVPTPRASVIVPAGSPLLTFTDGGAIYGGPCPAAGWRREHRIRIAHDAAKCDVCDTEFTAHLARLPLSASLLRISYLRLRF